MCAKIIDGVSNDSKIKKDACYDRCSTFRLKCFLNDGLLNPKSSEIRHFFFFCVILVVYVRQWNFSSGIMAVLFFLQISFGKSS